MHVFVGLGALTRSGGEGGSRGAGVGMGLVVGGDGRHENRHGYVTHEYLLAHTFY